MSSQEQETRKTVQALYDAYLGGDSNGMVDLMSEDVWVRFLGRVDLRGKDEARRFFNQNTPLLEDLDFRVRKLIVDGAYAAALWSETARTIHGEAYENHGVDMFEVRTEKIVMVHENNDINVHRSYFGRAD